MVNLLFYQNWLYPLFKLYALSFEQNFHVFGRKWHCAFAQFGDVERFEAVVVKIGIFLRQGEWLGGLAVGVNVKKVRFAIQSVVAFAGKNHPLRVGRKCVISVAVLGVDAVERIRHHRL